MTHPERRGYSLILGVTSSRFAFVKSYITTADDISKITDSGVHLSDYANVALWFYSNKLIKAGLSTTTEYVNIPRVRDPCYA